MSFNTYGSKSKSFGGNIPVWLEVDGTKVAGGVFEPAPTVGTTIPAGTPVFLDKIGGKIKLYNATTQTSVNGLLWHDVVMEEGDTVATGAVVDKGRVLLNRIPDIDTVVKTALSNISFEEEA